VTSHAVDDAVHSAGPPCWEVERWGLAGGRALNPVRCCKATASDGFPVRFGQDLRFRFAPISAIPRIRLTYANRTSVQVAAPSECRAAPSSLAECRGRGGRCGFRGPVGSAKLPRVDRRSPRRACD
jgi:hypothetical protein